MKKKIAKYKCECGYEFEKEHKPPYKDCIPGYCPSCGSKYFKWVNFKEFDK